MSLTALSLSSWLAAVLAWRLAALPSVRWRYLPALLPLAFFIAFALQVPAVAQGDVVQHTWQWVPSLQVAWSQRLDGFALLFALLITGIGTLVTVYATAYLAERGARERARFILLIQLFMAAMLGTVLADDVIALFVFWELTGLLSFLLIGFDAERPEARKAALQSLLVTAGGGLALFAGLLLIGIELRTFSLTEIAQRSDDLLASRWLTPAIVLILLGTFTKSAQFPFHFWLPQAMAAPTPASAYLHSATMVKLGVYLLARFDAVFADVPWFGGVLVGFGCATMLVAAVAALRATAYKAVLAQSTVASLGILVMLIGLDGPLAAVALCAFILSHALYKAALFFCAGTAIHATGTSHLRDLGGLARQLPWTAVAAALAGLSMAGVPLLFGFIAKEALFEAQWHSRWGVVPIFIAVLVNATMVAVAAVAVWRPFFAKGERGHAIAHGETVGLVVGPVLLGLLGWLAGVMPAAVGVWLLLPAAGAVHGTAIEGALALWHGWTPMLALSAVVVALGLVALAWWDRWQTALNQSPWLQRRDANRAYYAVVDGVLGAARWSTRQLQNGDMRRYTGVTCAVMVAVALWSVWRTGGLTALSLGGALLPLPAVLLLFGLIGALVAARTRSLVTGLIGVGVVGYGSALFFLLHGAPDLALTQFAVETLVLIVLMAVLVRLPAHTVPTRVARERWVDAGVAVAFGLVVFVALASMLALPFDARLSDFYRASSYVDAHGQNVVNVIIVDYRALDTLGEIAVVGFATLGVWALLRRRGRRSQTSVTASDAAQPQQGGAGCTR